MKKWIRMIAMILIGLCLAVSAAGEGTEIEPDVDLSHSRDGYIVVRKPETEEELMITVENDGRVVEYLFENESEALPLQLGSGTYTVTLYEIAGEDDPVPGNRVGRLSFEADVEDLYAPFLHPNCYVNYSPDSPWVQKAEYITEGITDPLIQYQAITSYIVKNYQYDFIKSVMEPHQDMLRPDIQYCWDNGLGIAQDLSALACAMLRSRGIPAMLIKGTIGEGTPHFWVVAVVNDDYLIFDPTARINATNKTEIFFSLYLSEYNKAQMAY